MNHCYATERIVCDSKNKKGGSTPLATLGGHKITGRGGDGIARGIKSGNTKKKRKIH